MANFTELEVADDAQKQIWWSNYQKYWNDHLDWVIKQAEASDELTAFKWSIIQQEVEMFIMLGKVVMMDDVNWIADRRGLNDKQKWFFIELIYATGIAGADVSSDYQL